MNWEEIYKSKLVSVEEAISSIKEGDKIVTGFPAVNHSELNGLWKKIMKISKM